MTTCTDVDPGQAGCTDVVMEPDESRGDRIRACTRALLLAFTVLTALAAASLLMLGGHTERYWPWTIPSRPTAAFLGAAYAAGFLLSALSLRQRQWRRVRVAVVTVTAFTALTLVPTLVHAHRLHLSDADPVARTAAWFWVAVYLAVPLYGLATLGRQEQGSRERDVVRRPLSTRLRFVLGGQGTVLVAIGLVLFLGGLRVHHGTSTLGVWPWPLTPIGRQVIGAWLLAFGIGAGLVLAEGDLSRLRVPAIAYTAFGGFQLIVLVVYGGQMNAARWGYGVLLAVVLATGGFGWWTTGRRRGTAVGSAARPGGASAPIRLPNGPRARETGPSAAAVNSAPPVADR